MFLRNPDSTELGQKIIKNSVRLIDKLGFEDFTFKKLADEIQSTEASVYRYFPEGRSDLLAAVAEELMEELRQRMRQAASVPSGRGVPAARTPAHPTGCPSTWKGCPQRAPTSSST